MILSCPVSVFKRRIFGRWEFDVAWGDYQKLGAEDAPRRREVSGGLLFSVWGWEPGSRLFSLCELLVLSLTLELQTLRINGSNGGGRLDLRRGLRVA